MNRVPAAVFVTLILCGCSSSAARPKADQQTELALAVVSSLVVQETSQLKPGQWTLYSVRTEGETATASTRLAVVSAEGNTYWIENRTTTPSSSGPQTMILKYQIDSTAKPLKAWVAKPPGRPAEMQMAPRPPAPSSRADVEIAKERITIPATGKTYDCTRLTSKAFYPDGRETKLVTWCSEEVPFSAVHDGKLYGGVVRRTYGPHTLELTAKGIDAVPELTLPEK